VINFGRVGKQNIHLSTRARTSPDLPNPVDEKLIQFARKRIRGVGKEAVDGIIIASSNHVFDELLPYAASKHKIVHYVVYGKLPRRLLGANNVTVLRDLLGTPRYR